MKVLSLFDGMACAMLAMQGAGVTVSRYVAYEYDETSANAEKGRPYGYAALASTHNFPMIEQKGDVFTADFTEYEGFDFLMGGSPCTYWSIAQKNNRETEASGMGWELFQQYVRAIKEAHPKYFIYENNKSMSKAIRESISSTFGFEPICINSALVSAQNRQRLYWCGIRQADGTYKKADIPQPADRGILLKDILESGCDLTSKDKGWTLTTAYGGAVAWNTIERSQRNMVCEPVYGASGVAERVGTYPNNAKNQQKHDSQQYRIYGVNGKSVTLCGGGGGMGAKTGLYAIPVEFENGIPTKAISCADGKTYDVYEVKNGLITIKGKQYPIKLADGFYIIRKLTVRECMRLQTVPEWYDFSVVSRSQSYKMLGNGWTVTVITHLIKHTLAGCVEDDFEQLTFDS